MVTIADKPIDNKKDLGLIISGSLDILGAERLKEKIDEMLEELQVGGTLHFYLEECDFIGPLATGKFLNGKDRYYKNGKDIVLHDIQKQSAQLLKVLKCYEYLTQPYNQELYNRAHRR